MSNTNKRLIILLSITAAAAGGYVAYNIYKKKNKATNNEPVIPAEETPEKKEDPIEKETNKFIFGDQIAMMPEATEIERTEYATKAAVYSEESEEEREEAEEAFEISKEYDAYRKKNKNKIIVLPEDNIDDTWCREIGNDPDNPDICYDEEELYYFSNDDTLTDEEGNIIDEEQYLGVKPRQFGWFTNEKEEIYIRNNPLERDFRVNKVQASREDYFPS